MLHDKEHNTAKDTSKLQPIHQFHNESQHQLIPRQLALPTYQNRSEKKDVDNRTFKIPNSGRGINPTSRTPSALRNPGRRQARGTFTTQPGNDGTHPRTEIPQKRRRNNVRAFVYILRHDPRLFSHSTKDGQEKNPTPTTTPTPVTSNRQSLITIQSRRSKQTNTNSSRSRRQHQQQLQFNRQLQQHYDNNKTSTTSSRLFNSIRTEES